MKKSEYKLYIYNTLTKQIEEVFVSKEIYEYYRRSNWNEKKKDFYYHKNTYPISNLVGGDNNAYENFHEFLSDSYNPEEQYIEKELVTRVMEGFSKLCEEDKEMLCDIYIQKKTMREYSEYAGIPLMTAQYRKRKILEKLKKYLEK